MNPRTQKLFDEIELKQQRQAELLEELRRAVEIRDFLTEKAPGFEQSWPLSISLDPMTGAGPMRREQRIRKQKMTFTNSSGDHVKFPLSDVPEVIWPKAF